jgi:integrase
VAERVSFLRSERARRRVGRLGSRASCQGPRGPTLTLTKESETSHASGRRPASLWTTQRPRRASGASRAQPNSSATSGRTGSAPVSRKTLIPVFPSLGHGGSQHGGGTLSHRNVQRRAWEPVRDALELPKRVTFDQLRHAFASRAHAQGVELQDLGRVMGHSSTGVTERVYVHLYGREKAEERFRRAMAQAR